MTHRFSLGQRSSGVLLHVTSLPGRHGIGDLGPAASSWVDFLAAAGQRWWQMLPIGPPGPGNSPYSASSAFAGSPLLVSLDRLHDDGLLDASETTPSPDLADGPVDHERAATFKEPRLRVAYRRFVETGGTQEPIFTAFCKRNEGWLADYALYAALRRRHGRRPWTRWPRPIRCRQRPAHEATCAALRDEIDFERFVQFQFDRQWSALKRYANQRGVGLIGDVPVFVAHDSSDVWSRRDLFDLDAGGHPRTVSGVPPDYFSPTGQRWGHPHYRWRRHRATGFAWWRERLGRALGQFDALRIDHFVGFHRLWAVPGRARTARSGRWVRTPGAELFAALRRRFGAMEIIAEDLGLMVPAAVALRDRFGFLGLRVLQFGFDGDGGRYHQPHTYPRRCVVCPGTHDNDTVAGWFEQLPRAPRRPAHELTTRERVLRYTGTSGRQIHWDFIRLALLSPADLAVLPAQDLLGLDGSARMNTPGTSRGNWAWRLRRGQFGARLGRRLRAMTKASGRLTD